MSMNDDEIDLRPYLYALRNKWWLILLVTVIAAGVAFAYSFTLVSKYNSSATILLTRTRTMLSLANQLQTITEPIDFRSRMDAMLAIANSESLVVQTLEDIQQEFPDNGITREALRSAIDISSTGDTIKVTATYTDPFLATVMADAWAHNVITAINYAYSGEQLPAEIQAGLEPARQEFETAQAELEAFLNENQVTLLEKQIVETSTLLDELVQNRTWEIAYNVRRKQKMEQVIDQAQALVEQLSTSKSSTAAGLGDALAVLKLHAEAFGGIEMDSGIPVISSSSPPGMSSDGSQGAVILASRQPDLVFDIQITDLIDSVESGQSYQRDLERIIEHAEQEKEEAESALIELAHQSLNVEDDELITATSERLRTLQSQLEEENATLNDLISQRDLTLQAYQALAQKETEVRNNLQTSSTVTLASPAVTPNNPAGRGVVQLTSIAGALGFFISTLYVIVSVWFRSLGEVTSTSDEN